MTPAAIATAIKRGAAQLPQEITDTAADKLALLLLELQRWNARFNLTAIRDLPGMISGHVLDSLTARPLLKGTRILDVGTGAGFPGLPLAIVDPELEITLLDSNGKKIRFVQHVIGELGLGNASTVHSRVERYAPEERFDTVIARAFAPLPRMLAQTGHLIAETGMLLALKGKYPAAELAELGEAAETWKADVSKLKVPGLDQHERHAICLTRQPEVRA
ncbi:MAG: 16S rRNA (guanine(527)-N(7))-methyltransferase RsmG [Woeseia sp.]